MYTTHMMITMAGLWISKMQHGCGPQGSPAISRLNEFLIQIFLGDIGKVIDPTIIIQQ